MTLTPAQQTLLEAPFRLDEHRFDLQGNVYLDKAAIRRRFSLVDPGWSQSNPVVVSQTANAVALSASITIAGSMRSATGVAIINRWKKADGGKKVEVDGYDLARAERLAYKYADADLLPRIGQQFNVGIYLKVDAIKSIKTEAALKEFLAKLPPPPGAHWSLNGGRELIGALLKLFNLKWEDIKDLIEPGRTLSGLSDTTLDEPTFIKRVSEIALMPAKPRNGTIAYLNCDLQFLAVDDVLDHSSKGGNGMRRCHERIVTISEQNGGTRSVTLLNTETNAERTVDLTSTGNHTIVGGPKLAAVNANPALAPVKGAHRVWIGEEVAVS